MSEGSDCDATTNPRSWHSSASNRLAERAIRTIGEQLRTIRCVTQNWYKTNVTPSSALWSRMVGYSVFCVTRYSRGAGGITPFRATYDRDYTQEIVPLAENQDLGTRTPWIVVAKVTTLSTPLGRGVMGVRTIRRRNVQNPHSYSRYKEYLETWYRTHQSWESTSLATSPRKPYRRQIKQFK